MFRLVLLSAIFFCGYVNCVQVCDDCKYYVKPDKQHCHDNPDGEKNLTDILKGWPGVTVEEHNVFTEDGYQILLVRAYGKQEKDPVVLGQGIFVTVFAWVNRGKKSIAHRLIEEGHEVWIINFRGSKYSREHKNLTVDDDAYWEFSFDEVGEYDIDAALQLVKEKTSKKAIYIGYGLGGTAGFVYAIKRATSAEANLKGSISLGPAGYLTKTKSYLRYLLPLAEYFRPIIYQRTHGELPLSWGEPNCTSLLDYYAEEVREVPLYGDDFKQIDDEYLPIKKIQNHPDGVNIDVLVHLAQVLKSKEFQPRDCGKEENLKKYGQETPPPYKISEITVPQAFFVGNNDWLSTKQDDKEFYDKLQPSAQCGFQVIKYDKWNHKDFFEAKDIEELLIDPLYEVVTTMCEEKC